MNPKTMDNFNKLWEFMYVSSREYLYQKIPKEDVLEFTMTDKKYLDTIRTLENPKITELANEMGYTKTSVTERINKRVCGENKV